MLLHGLVCIAKQVVDCSLRTTTLTYYWPGFAILFLTATGSFLFHFCSSSCILSILAGFRAHKQPFREELPDLFSTFSKHLFKDKLWRTEFFQPSGAVWKHKANLRMVFQGKKSNQFSTLWNWLKKNQNQNKRKVILMPKWTYCVPYNWNMGFYTWLLHYFCFTLIFKPVVEAGGFFKPHSALKWFFHVYFLVSAQAKFHPYSEDSFARRKKKLLITLRCCIWACWFIS